MAVRLAGSNEWSWSSLRGFRLRAVSLVGWLPALPGRVRDGGAILLKGRTAVAMSPLAAELDALAGLHKIATGGSTREDEHGSNSLRTPVALTSEAPLTGSPSLLLSVSGASVLSPSSSDRALSPVTVRSHANSAAEATPCLEANR